MSFDRAMWCCVLVWLALVFTVGVAHCKEAPVPVPDMRNPILGCDCSEHVAGKGIMPGWHITGTATEPGKQPWRAVVAIVPTQGPNDAKARTKALLECGRWLTNVTKILKHRAAVGYVPE